jgi:hypothetical protein
MKYVYVLLKTSTLLIFIQYLPDVSAGLFTDVTPMVWLYFFFLVKKIYLRISKLYLCVKILPMFVAIFFKI